ncbi:hypothetical protein ACSVBT_05070 [Afipia sp. TerB]
MPIRRSLRVALLLMLGLHCASAETLDRSLVIADPQALRALDIGGERADPDRRGPASGLGLGRMMRAGRPANRPISGAELFALPALAPVKAALDNELMRYAARTRTGVPNSPASTGGSEPPPTMQVFDRDALYAPDTRFILAGVVNRMDRAFRLPGGCGEIRLIYRPVVTRGDVARLPLTLDLILKARGDQPGASQVPCGELARRWLDLGTTKDTGEALAARLIEKGGALEFVTPAAIDRIEINMQIGHEPTGAATAERADYLIKSFQYNAGLKVFEQGPLENQIDFARIVADARLTTAFQKWILDPKHLVELDRGTVIIPPEYLAMRAMAATPAALDGGREAATIFKQADVVEALAAASRDGAAFENIRSFTGFERRLDDVTCSGCHETRAIGGFHFPGSDWMSKPSADAVPLPASPHFIADQPRRRDILQAVRDGAPVDYSRGFSARPQARRSSALAGTTYLDGWGAYCALSDGDASFASWTCADGLACRSVSQNPVVAGLTGGGTKRPPLIGMCFLKGN